MDKWKYFDITHKEHILCNPMSLQKLEQLVSLLHLRPGSRVLDIAMGKAEFIIRLAERYNIKGIGIDLSPYCVADARQKHMDRVPESQLSFIEMDAAEYIPEKPESFDLVACIGASWIYGGHQGTLKALNRMVTRDGWIVVGEPFWVQEPVQDYLDAINEDPENYGTHFENVEAGEKLGLRIAYTLVSNQDDWDKYEGLQWYAAEQWVSEHEDDPDVGEVLRQVYKNKAAYLKWGRETLGWSIYAFKKGRYEL